MIKVPLDALAMDTEEGDVVVPEMGDEVSLQTVSGEVIEVGDDYAHIELRTAGGMPIEYVSHKEEEKEVDEAEMDEAAMAAMESELLAAAAEEDEKRIA